LLGQGEEEKKVELHQPSLIRQIIYNMLITCLSFSLTVWTVVLLQEKESVFLKDSNGVKQQIDPSVIYFTLGISWVGTLLSWLISICFYAIHPARVGFNLRDKCHIWCFGTKIELLCSKESDVDEAVASKDDIEATASCSSASEDLDSTKVSVATPSDTQVAVSEADGCFGWKKPRLFSRCLKSEADPKADEHELSRCLKSDADPKADEHELGIAAPGNHLVCEEAASVADESKDLDSTKVSVAVTSGTQVAVSEADGSENELKCLLLDYSADA